MRRLWIAMLWGTISWSAGSATLAQEPQADDAQKAFELAAQKLEILDAKELLYDGPVYYFARLPDAVAKEHRQTLRSLFERDEEMASLVGLLAHGDPRVRTLAILALFDKEDPQVLPYLAALAGDPEKTFPKPKLFTSSALISAKPRRLGAPPARVMPPVEPQTVGEVAKAAVEFYMKRAGYHYGIEGMHGNPDFAAYWRSHGKRRWCASWFSVWLDRATQGVSPLQEKRIPRIREVRRRIDQVPEPDRTLILIALFEEPGGRHLISEKELMAAARRLGPNPLIATLERSIPTADPDLQPDNKNRIFRQIVWFILKHADELLKPQHAGILLASSYRERSYTANGIKEPIHTPAWAIAAARLRPDRAVQLLRREYAHFQGEHDGRDRVALSAALWELEGPSQIPYLVDWFYKEQITSSIPNERSEFLRKITGWKVVERSLKITGAEKPGIRRLVARIVQDKRFQSLDYQSLRTLVRIVNQWLDEPLITLDQLFRVSHPLGMVHFSLEREKALGKYPKETQAVLETLALWRAKLRASVSRFYSSPVTP